MASIPVAIVSVLLNLNSGPGKLDNVSDVRPLGPDDGPHAGIGDVEEGRLHHVVTSG